MERSGVNAGPPIREFVAGCSCATFSRERAGADGIQPVVSRAEHVENNRLDRTPCWTFASKLATIQFGVGQHRPVTGSRIRNERMSRRFIRT